MMDWQRIVTEHGPAVWRTAYRLLRNNADADDCMQEAFLSAVEISRREPVRNWGALLTRITTARAVDRLRRRLREAARRDDPADVAAVPETGPSPDARAQDAELAARLLMGISRLPSRQAEAFFLRFLSDLAYDEIADELGIEANHVGVLLHRARSKLQGLMDGVVEVRES